MSKAMRRATMSFTLEDFEDAMTRLRGLSRFSNDPELLMRCKIAQEMVRFLDYSQPGWRKQALKRLSHNKSPGIRAKIDLDLDDLTLRIDEGIIPLKELLNRKE
jgi:hypothetical protein